ncbi:MAG: hypothetical protein K9I82_17710 [Chitinophagaceae bacterium]|nr:hypothetical protein [Chitinophagaceae bacterium]
MNKMISKMLNVYDSLSNIKRVHLFEITILKISILSFIAHICFIFFSNTTNLIGNLDQSYLKAIYTPFSFILYYEVFLLVIIIPKSISEFIGKQFEIIALITLRGFFHDIADINFSEIHTLDNPNFISILYDLSASAIMLFTTFVYNKMYKSIGVKDATVDLNQFIKIKKLLSVIMCGVLVILSFISLITWLTDVSIAFKLKSQFPNPNTVFYSDFFTIMIFVDVLLLIISFIYQCSFNLIFRNASFIITTILLRMSLSMEKPINYLIILLGFTFSIVTYYLYSKMVFDKKEE